MCSHEIEDIFRKKDNKSFKDEEINLVRDLITNRKNISKKEIESSMRKLRKKHSCQPNKNTIRKIYESKFSKVKINNNLKNWMIKKIMRKQSGVNVVTIVLPPEWDDIDVKNKIKFSCSKDCAYCPIETDLQGNPTQPRSYLSGEPAMRRATRVNFSVQGQVFDRIDCYLYNGIMSEEDFNNYKKCFKLEVIISGGTFECYPKNLRENVMKELYWAANNYKRKNVIQEINLNDISLENEIKNNETSKFRIIGLTIETRPDFINKYSIRDYRKWGVTRVQIGVQHYDDKILKKIKRDCYTKHTINAIRLLKQVGLKVVVHLMPDLPGSSPDKDIWMFKQAINNPDLQFDDVKIYPTAVCKSHDPNLIVKSLINDWYKEGSYKPYAEENLDTLINVLLYYLTNMNPWVRIQRLVRDIPANEIEAGYKKKINLRQMVNDIIKKENLQCNDIRFKEIKDKYFPESHRRLVVRKYNASKGIEYHISVEAESVPYYHDIFYLIFKIYQFVVWFFTGYKVFYSGNLKQYQGCYGFCRLRIDPDAGGKIIPEINNSAMIREVHVYGNSASVNNNNSKSQHRGFGKLMVATAEDLARNHNFNKITVIAGIGTREYYKNKCDYYLPIGGTYMHKYLSTSQGYLYRTLNCIVFFNLIIAIYLQYR